MIPCKYLDSPSYPALPQPSLQNMMLTRSIPEKKNRKEKQSHICSNLVHTSASLTNHPAMLLHNAQARRAECTGSSVCLHILEISMAAEFHKKYSDTTLARSCFLVNNAQSAISTHNQLCYSLSLRVNRYRCISCRGGFPVP